ncbi:unnamed protein product [Caenorhabditis angaria]|uniref:Neurotransmitter-gated ion-channel ligand-binding domain-containing protein n=1 Tax=Caenorhabditis angaria TaxID=860376 RepID=A0A9P1IR20_9PELO|nr:unnamed protein product [Caenorhabditis angaria]
MSKDFLIFLLIFLQINYSQSEIENRERSYIQEAHQALHRDIFNQYDKNASPIFQDLGELSNDTWSYSQFFDDLTVTDIDEANELISVVVDIYQVWTDYRLTWDPAEYGNISYIFTRQDAVWSPPFSAFSTSEIKDHRDQMFRSVGIQSNGSLMAHVPMEITATCNLVMDDFPFDFQICEIKTGTALFPAAVYTMGISVAERLRENPCLMGNSGWDVINMTTGVITVDGHDESDYKALQGVIRFHLKRNSSFYIYMIILPIVIINGIAFLGIFLKKNTKIERVTVGLTHIMTMTFILGMMGEKIPHTAKVPLLGLYIIFSLCSMIVAIFLSTYRSLIAGYLRNIKSDNDNAADNHQKEPLVPSAPTKSDRLYQLFHTWLRYTFIILLQLVNLASFFYMIYRYIDFELTHRDELNRCAQAKTSLSMDFEYNSKRKEL